jgi:hypothetical protein
MSLDRAKLEKLRELGNGSCRAQCPACAEAGQDRKGEHLRISPEGKFGCCVFPGDREHRKRIFALAGEHGAKAIKVRVASRKTAPAVQLDLLGRLGRAFGSPESRAENACGTVDLIGTLGTGFQYPRAYADNQLKDDLFIRKLIGSEEPVPSVPRLPVFEPASGGDERLPYLTPGGTLVIPFESPERFHWWNGGQSVNATLAELRGKERDATTV